MDDHWGRLIIFNGWMQWVNSEGIARQALIDNREGLVSDMFGEIILCGPIYEGRE